MHLIENAIHIFGPQGFFSLGIAGKLLLAIGIGILMGLERELASKEQHMHALVGLRTMSFASLLGAITLLFDPSGAMTLAAFIGLCFVVIAGYVVHALKDMPSGITTSITSLISLLLGAMVMAGSRDVVIDGVSYTVPLTQLAVFTAVIVTILLSAKSSLDRTVVLIKPVEFLATMKFAVVTFVILPFLPDRPLSDVIQVDNPLVEAALSSINLASLWLLVVLISGIGFVGYILSRFIGHAKGIGLSGFLGGIVSSTAVMGAMAARSKESGRVVLPLVIATTIATITSFFRLYVEIAFVNRSILDVIVWPLLAMALTGMIGLRFLRDREHRAETAGESPSLEVEHESPFALKPALKFTILILIIKLVVKVILVWSGGGAKSTTLLYIVAFISGFADADAFALAVATEALHGTIPLADVASSIVLVVVANMISKTGIAALFGSKAFRKQTALPFIAITLVGIAAMVLLKLFL